MPGEQLGKKPRAGNPTTGDVKTRELFKALPFQRMHHPSGTLHLVQLSEESTGSGLCGAIPRGTRHSRSKRDSFTGISSPDLTALGQSSLGNGA